MVAPAGRTVSAAAFRWLRDGMADSTDKKNALPLNDQEEERSVVSFRSRVVMRWSIDQGPSLSKEPSVCASYLG